MNINNDVPTYPVSLWQRFDRWLHQHLCLLVFSRMLFSMVVLAGLMMLLASDLFAATHGANTGSQTSPEKQTSLSLLHSSAKQHWQFSKGITDEQQLVISGINTDSATARLLIRIDSKDSVNYFTRFNREQLLPSGKFHFTLPLSHLRTERKQPIAPEDIRQIFLTPLSGTIRWHEVLLAELPQLPDGLIGWDFGPSAQTLASGFTAIDYPLSPEDQALGVELKGSVRSRNRPYFDPALADGFEGLTALTLPIKNGLWKVRLWVDDIGEWEYLPHALKRSITINGQPVLLQNLDAEQWLHRFYLNRPELVFQSNDPEAVLNQLQDSFWQSFAKERGHPIDALVEVTNQKLNLTFSSPDSSGRYISALLAAPANTLEELANAQQGFDIYDQRRLSLFRQYWPVVPNPELDQHLPALIPSSTTPVPLFWAHNEEVSLRVAIPQHAGQLEEIHLPLKNLKVFRIETGLRRAGGQENALQPQRFLQPLRPEHLHQVSEQAEEWIITGRVHFNDRSPSGAQSSFQPVAFAPVKTQSQTGLIFSKRHIPLSIKPLAIDLPDTNKPVGIYLDYAPHLSWFDPESQQVQADCDYKVLQQFGLTGVAPALPTPFQGEEVRFKRAAQSPLLHGLRPPFPAYTPVKRLLPDATQQSRDKAIIQLDKLKNTFPLLLWSLADEPGLHLKSDEKLDLFRSQLKQTLPEALVLAQLNHSHHDQLTSHYDAVLINHGYGLHAHRLEQLKQSGTQTYLYNLPYLRFAAGLYLWRSGAQGFWQWHGRMPTAHPYDPTDGREDDVQMLMPTAGLCQPPVMHSALLGIRQGINDLRWLEWLMQNANQDIDSAILLQQIRQQISVNWDKNTSKKAIKNNQLTSNIIQQIKQLAQPVQPPG